MTIAARTFCLALLAAMCLMLAGCGDVSEKLIGAWKSENPLADTGKPAVILITKDSVNVNGSISQIKFNAVGLTVDLFDTVNQNSVFFATKIEKDSMVAQGRVFAEKTKLVRISTEEAQKMLDEM